MPLYEFECEDCTEIFEELVRSATSTSEVLCPACQSQRVHKKMSTIAARISSSSASSFGSPSAGAACSPGSI